MNKVSFVKVLWNRELVGRIALTPDGLCAFEYSAQFLNSGRSISPFELPLRGGVTIAKRHPFDGGFGVFDDCLPDGRVGSPEGARPKICSGFLQHSNL
ncbi:MAG: HipA N-terminal domain-containing protein [Bacteroidales bacterium]|nr:HipA N-terminal domain-containing protein [Bacteroidales bacterium]